MSPMIRVRACLAAANDPWLGAPKYWSGFDSETNTLLVEDAGLIIETADIQKGGAVPHRFLWIVARKPA